MSDTSSTKLSSMASNLVFKQLDLTGLRVLIDLALTEGWNPGLSDAELFYVADKNGFYGCFIGGELIGGGSLVSYNDDFGFMGLFIVKPEFRGTGIGTRLWHFRKNTLLARLNNDAAIGMDGVVTMQDFYKKGGFEISFRDERYLRIGEVFESDPNVSDFNIGDLTAILDFDLECFGVNRKKFLVPWLLSENARSITYKSADGLKGFAVIRKCHLGYKIGPLFAENFSVAEALYKTCLTIGQGEQIFLDIPVVNKDAVELVKKFKAKYVFECARMYAGSPPKTSLIKVFGITSFELG